LVPLQSITKDPPCQISSFLSPIGFFYRFFFLQPEESQRLVDYFHESRRVKEEEDGKEEGFLF